MKKENRDPFIDILKGIGIISVVLGHSGILLPGLDHFSLTGFVYLYHLMIFFLTTGMVYNPQKYTDPYLYIGKQLKSSLPLYVTYTLTFIFLHNLFASMHLVDIPVYSLGDMLVHTASTFSLLHTEFIGGALWFVPTLLFAKAFFAVGFQWAQKQKIPWLAHLAVLIITGGIGIITNHRNVNLFFHMQTAFLGVPVIYLGYICQLYREKLRKIAHPIVGIACAVFMYWFLKQNRGYIELSQNLIISPFMFYPMTGCGMLFCISLASVIQKWNCSTRLFSYIGTISFHIMASHFLVFKLFDWIYGRICGMSYEVTMRFPGAFDYNGLVYTLLGVGIPAIILYVIRKLRHKA